MTRPITRKSGLTQRGLPTADAAWFVGCKTVEQFEREVAAGIWPQPFRKDSRPKRWDVEALQARMDRMSGISRRGTGMISGRIDGEEEISAASEAFEERARSFNGGHRGA